MRRLYPLPAHAARRMIVRHGLQAAALVQQYASAAEMAGDAGGLHHWRQVQAAIGDLRRTDRLSDERRADTG